MSHTQGPHILMAQHIPHPFSTRRPGEPSEQEDSQASALASGPTPIFPLSSWATWLLGGALPNNGAQ